MLYLNGEPLKLNIDSKKVVKTSETLIKEFILDKLNELGYAKLGNEIFPLKLSFHSKYLSRSEDEEGRPGPIEHPANMGLTNMRNVQDEKVELSGTWLRSEGLPKKGKDDRLMPVPRYFHMQKVTYIPKEQIELVWWLMWVYKDKFNKDYVLVNKLGDAKANMRLTELKLNVQSAIVTDRYFKEEQIRDLAAIYGVAGAHRQDIDLIRSELLNVVELEEIRVNNNGEAYEKFLRTSKFDERTKKEAFIRKCEDELVIVYENRSNAWHYGTKQGQLGNKIVSVTNYDNRYAEMIDFISAYDETFEKMKEQFAASVAE